MTSENDHTVNGEQFDKNRVLSKENEFLTKKKDHYVIEATWAKLTSENDHTVNKKVTNEGYHHVDEAMIENLLNTLFLSNCSPFTV